MSKLAEEIKNALNQKNMERQQRHILQGTEIDPFDAREEDLAIIDQKLKGVRVFIDTVRQMDTGEMSLSERATRSIATDIYESLKVE